MYLSLEDVVELFEVDFVGGGVDDDFIDVEDDVLNFV